MSGAGGEAAARWRRRGTDLALLFFFMVVFYGLVWAFSDGLREMSAVLALVVAVCLTWAVDLAVRRIAGQGEGTGTTEEDGHGQG